MTDAPRSAADPRPRGIPYYIDPACPDCGTELILYDELDALSIWESDGLATPPRSDEIWHDEWVCPSCLEGVHMDVPDAWWDELVGRAEDSEIDPIDWM